MRTKPILMVLLLSIFMAASNAGGNDDQVRNVPQPVPSRSREVPTLGVGAGFSQSLENENLQLKQLIRQQEEKIKLLESRIKALEGAKK